MKEIEIDYRDDNTDIKEKDNGLEIRLMPFPKGYVGKIEQEFIEKEDKPGEFEEFIFKEIEEDDREC